MNKLILLFCCLISCQFLAAQSLLINGNIVTNESSPEGAKVIIAKNGNRIDEQSITKKGRFDLKLALGADYKITFTKDGYVTKTVSINTEVPEESIEANPNFPPVKLIINLLPHMDGVDLGVFDQPIAILAYSPELDDFTFDKDYSDKIKDRVAQTEQELKRLFAARGTEALEKERKFAGLVNKGQQSFDHQEWNQAISYWNQALEIKPEQETLKQQIATAQKEMELEASRKAIELQNAQAYQYLIASADSLFNTKKYAEAKEKYTTAQKLKTQETYPRNQIREIDSILANLAKQEADKQKEEADKLAAYKKTIAIADQAFAVKDYNKSITSYRQALEIKNSESYPKEMIAKAEQALADLQIQEAAETERKRLEQERINGLKNKYHILIQEADSAFRIENFALAKIRYNEADHFNLGETYPKEQIREIDKIINSSQYRTKLTEYNKNKTLAEKSMQQKNYAGAKVYFQKALSILSIDKEAIEQKIVEIDRLIEASRLAEIEKTYKENIGKADKAYQEKAYAVARFYYKKALEIKIGDKYAFGQLQEVEKFIGERQSKEAEL